MSSVHHKNNFVGPLLLLASCCSRFGVLVVKSVLLFYRFFLSPLLGRTCRFYPSCSQYALDAVDKYGVGKGIGLSFLRLAKCHPFHPGGFDPLR